MTTATVLLAVGWAVVGAAVLLLLAEETLYRIQSVVNRTVRADDWVLRHRRKLAVGCLAIATYLLSSAFAHVQSGSTRLARRAPDRSLEIMGQLNRQQALIAQIIEQRHAEQPAVEPGT